MKCKHCGRTGADNHWNFYACAEGGRNREAVLCDECDLEANEWMLSFFNVRGARGKIKRYSEGQTSDTYGSHIRPKEEYQCD